MTTLKSYQLSNVKRDLSDVLSTIIADSPSFITLFADRGRARQTKHEWLEDQLKPKKIAYSAYCNSSANDGVPGTFTVTDSTGWTVGDYIKIAGNPAIFKIASITATTIVVSLVAANGGYSALSSTGSPATSAGTLCFVSHPVDEASSTGLEAYRQSSTEWNATQIVRRDVMLSATAASVETYGMENVIYVQEAEALRQIAHEMNDMALFGVRSLRAAASIGTAGGLYYYGTQNTSLACAQASSPSITTKILNSAAQKIVEAGGNPTVILCGTGQARVISRLYSTSLHVTQADQIRGSYVSQIVNEATGALMRVIVEPKLDDTEVWVIDPTGFGIVWLRNIVSSDATASNMDGQCRKIIGELSFEFRNAKQKLCRISGLEAAATTLA